MDKVMVRKADESKIKRSVNEIRMLAIRKRENKMKKNLN
jgi:hypothetical protein